jgi:Rhs element Vgr protein
MTAILPNSTLNANPSYSIQIAGTEIAATFVIFSIHVWQEANKISKARIIILGGDSYQSTFIESEEDKFEPGKEIEIKLGFDQKNESVFKGVISKHALNIRPGYEQSTYKNALILDCSDKAVKMTTEKKSEIFEKKKDSDIIATLISEAGLSKEVKATTYQHPFMTQYQMTNWDFLLKRCLANGLIVFNASNKISVVEPKVSGTAVAEIKYGDGAISFQGEMDATEQFQTIEAKSWNPFTEKEVKQTSAEPDNLDKPGNLKGKELGKVFFPTKATLKYDAPIPSSELKNVADALLVESRLFRARGTVSFRGINKIKLGSIVKLSGFGKRFNGDILVTSVAHEMAEGKYTTTVGFGFPRNFFSEKMAESSEPLVPPIAGLYPAIVKKIDGDPDSSYRIQVQIPALKESGNGIWAYLTQFYTTKSAGSFFVPEIDSEVIVGFLHNDPRFPVVLGGLYNSKNKPYTEFDKKNPKKAILSAQKLTLEFDDADKVITIKTPGKNSITISDKDKSIEIKDQNGNSVKTSSSGIDIKSSKAINIKSSQKITLEGATGIELKSTGGDINQKGLNVNAEAQIKFSGKGTAQAELNASGQVAIKGAVVMIN